MSRIVLVGGAGYIGSRLVPRFKNYDCHVVDPQILSPLPGTERIQWNEFEYDADDTVVWLASIHKVPPAEEEKWRVVYEDLCFDGPDCVIGQVKRFVYISSMQTILGEPSLYAKEKSAGESVCFRLRQAYDSRVVRLGTVWGGFNRPGPQRLHTVPNAWLALGKRPPKDYCSYTCEMDKALDAIVQATLRDDMVRTVTNVTDFIQPSSQNDVYSLSVPPADDPDFTGAGPHPMELYAEYYNIR